MRQVNDPSGRLRFGVFEVDLRAGELTKRGVRIRLQEQPFQVLAMLLEKPGELVTREELRKKLWGQTVVDFDHGLKRDPRFRALAAFPPTDSHRVEIASRASRMWNLWWKEPYRVPENAYGSRHRKTAPQALVLRLAKLFKGIL